jgi:hypothetical protein
MPEVINAVEYSGGTMVGSFGKFPRTVANCFDIRDDAGEYWRVVNFRWENLQELLRRRVVAWPVRCERVGERWVQIADTRIPEDWYSPLCATCWPVELRSSAA